MEAVQLLISQAQVFGYTNDDRINLLSRYLEDIKSLEEALKKLILDSKIEFVVDEANKNKFIVYEKEFLRLLKRAEILPIYDACLKKFFNTANTLYKIYKLYFEPASHKKWVKVNEQLNEALDSDASIRKTLEDIGVF